MPCRSTLDRFAETTFVVADSDAGLLARPDRDGPVIDLFTGPSRIGRDARGARLRAITGRRLLAEVPVGHRYVIDPGWPSECEVRIEADRISIIPRALHPG